MLALIYFCNILFSLCFSFASSRDYSSKTYMFRGHGTCHAVKVLQLTINQLDNLLNSYILKTITATSEVADAQKSIRLKSWKEIPGPKTLPILGATHHFFPGGEMYNINGLERAEKLFKNYGPIIRLDRSIGSDCLIILFDAESVSQVLRGENWLPVRQGFETLAYYRSNLKENNKPGRPTGLSTDHYEIWRELRTVVNPVLLQPKTIQLYRTVLDEVAIDTVNRLKSLRDENNMIKCHLDQEINKWALESIGVVGLGCRMNCLDPNLPEDSPVKQLIQCVHKMLVLADDLEFKPSLWRYFATPTYKRAMKNFEKMDILGKIFIDKAIQDFKTKSKTDDEKGVLEKLLEINEEIAYIMASDMLFGGVDTTANSVTAAFYLLAKNPEKQNKLREEILSDEEKRPYLKACIKEAIRMMPAASGNTRLTSKEYNLLGYKIPKGMKLVFAHHNMSLMNEHFPRASEYLPERWIVDKDDPLSYKNAHPFAYSPFGFGARSCIGRKIAELQMELLLAQVVENFHVEWFGGEPKIEQTSINYFKGPFNFIFKDVKNN